MSEPGWREKDDLDLTADDIEEMLDAGEPVEIVREKPEPK